MKKIITVILAVLMLTALFTVTAYADDSGTFGEDNALTWTFSGNKLVIDGTGAIPAYGSGMPWSAYSADIGVIAIGDGITAIGDNAFSDCINCTDISVPCTLENSQYLPQNASVASHHIAREVPAVAATNCKEGVKQHYVCTNPVHSNLLFSDSGCTTQITEDDIVIPKVDLDWKYIPGTKIDTLKIYGGTTITDYTSIDETPWAEHKNNIEEIYIYCGITYVGKNAFPTTVDKLTIPCALAGNGNLPKATSTDIIHDDTKAVYHEAKAASYTTEGNKEYWTCANCGKYFTDSALKNETTWDQLVIPKTDTNYPIPKSITLSQDTVTINYADTNVTVTVLAEDNESGVKDAGYITFYNQTANEYLKCNLNKNGIYLTGVLNVYETITPGTYTVQTLTLADNAGNSHEYTYQELVSCGCAKALYIVRSYKITPVLTVSFTTTTVGYGGTLTGKVTLTDSKGYPLTNRTVDVYSGTTKIATVVTGSDGTAEFKYTSYTSGTYYVKATYAGDSYFNTRTSDPVTVTFTTVPATGDTYGVVTWSLVVLTALGINAWVLLRRRRS